MVSIKISISEFINEKNLQKTIHNHTNLFKEEEEIKAAAEDGWHVCDYSSLAKYCDFKHKDSLYNHQKEWMAYIENTKRLFDKYGVEVYQTHAPFIDYKPNDEEYMAFSEALKKAAVATGIMGAKYMVIHPLMPGGWNALDDKTKTRKYNYEFLSPVIEFAAKQDVNIAIENWPIYRLPCADPEEHCEYVDMFAAKNVVACLDTGHLNVAHIDITVKKQREPILQSEALCILKDRVKVLHIHDNLQNTDAHLVPQMGNIDWDDFARALKAVNYSGTLNFETLPCMIREDGTEYKCYDFAQKLIKDYDL